MPQTLTDLIGRVPPTVIWITAVTIGLGVLTLAFFALRAALRAVSRFARTRIAPRPAEDVLTVISAAIATGVSAQGMWRFSGDVLGFDGPLQLLLFAFIEVAVITSAVRARRNMREKFSAGIDGLAVWALTSLSAVLSSMDARSFAEALFRLAAPLVAAWLWERGMAVERHRITGRSRINWRITPERMLVRVGLAEAQDRTADEVDARRRFDRVALAAKRVRALREADAKPRTIARATARLERFYAAAHAHTGIGRDVELQRALASEIASLYSAGALVDLEPASAWTPPAEPSDLAELIEETRRMSDGVAARGETRAALEELRAIEANISMLASDLTGRRVINPVNNGVTEPVMIVPPEWTGESPGVTPKMTPAVTGPDVIDPINFDVNDPAVFDLPWPPPALADVIPALTAEVTPGDVNDDVTDQRKADVMRAFWEQERKQGRYPRVVDLANAASADKAQASRLRAELVDALPFWERRKASPKQKKAAAVNGSAPTS